MQHAITTIMLTKKAITVALFAVVIASSLVVVSGLAGSTLAAAKKRNEVTNTMVLPTTAAGKNQNAYGTVPTVAFGKDQSKSTLPAVLRSDKSGSSAKPVSADSGSSSGPAAHTTSMSSKELKVLYRCESNAASNGGLTLTEVKDCYTKAF